jgi:hypothetical protein
VRWIDILDLITQNFYAPRIARLVEFRDNVLIDRSAFFERSVEIYLADFTTQRSLSKLRNREHVISDSVGCSARIQDLHVQHTVNTNLNVVLGNTDLLVDIRGLLFQRMFIGDTVQKRKKNVEARIQCFAVLTQTFNNKSVLLRHDHCCLEHNDNRNKYKTQRNNQ